MSKKAILLVLLLSPFLGGKLLAQNDSINAQYFSDNGIAGGKNVIKLNMLSPIVGELAVHYERVLTDMMSLEVGGGAMLSYHVPDLIDILSGDGGDITDPSLGYCLYIHPKFYPQREAPELSFTGPMYRKRVYNMADRKVVYNDLTWNYGFQLMLAHRMVLDYNLGLGFRFKSAEFITDPDAANIPFYNNNYEDYRFRISGLAMPWTIKLGIIL